jgi:hypothetical protein
MIKTPATNAATASPNVRFICNQTQKETHKPNQNPWPSDARKAG